jgi:general secretion pathway protein K
MNRQRGAALIIAMMVLALAATIAVAVSSDYQLQLRRAQNHQTLEQAKQLLLGAEQLAMLALLTDSRSDSPIDGGQDIWAQPPQPYPVDGGWMLGSVVDLQGRFNLNSLLVGLRDTQTEPVAVPYTAPQQQFVKLLLVLPELKLTRAQAIEMTEAVIDWLDANQQPTGFGGKEDDYYLSDGLSYRTADHAMVSASELRAVGGVSEEMWQLLAPHVTALPMDTAGININMLTPPVLASLAPGEEPMALEAASAWVDELRSEPLEDIQLFVSDARWETPLPPEGLQLTSDFFQFNGQVKLGDSVLEMTSVIYRKNQQLSVVQRALGAL